MKKFRRLLCLSMIAAMALPSSALLKGVSPAVSPDLLRTLAEMGHGDEIVFADAHFPAHSLGVSVIRAEDRLIGRPLEFLAQKERMQRHLVRRNPDDVHSSKRAQSRLEQP